MYMLLMSQKCHKKYHIKSSTRHHAIVYNFRRTGFAQTSSAGLTSIYEGFSRGASLDTVSQISVCGFVKSQAYVRHHPRYLSL